MKTRLQYIVKQEGLTNQKFAAEIGISPAAVTHILSGRNNPSIEIISKIASRYPNYSLRWLILGEQPTFVSEANITADKPEMNNGSTNTATSSPADSLLSLPFDASTPTPETDAIYLGQPGSRSSIKPANTTPSEPSSELQKQDTTDTATATSCDKLIVCFPDGTFHEYTRK